MREVLEELIRLHAPCFDIERPFVLGQEIYDAYAFCKVTNSRYVLVERAELWRACTFEHVFFREMDAFTEEAQRGYERQIRERIEPEFVRKGAKYPPPDHMCTYITGIFISRGEMSRERIRQIRRHRSRRDYRFSLRGYYESRLVVFDLAVGRIYGSRAAGPLVKRYRRLIQIS